MATWADMSKESYKAAIVLRKLKNRRSCISRAYYAAFCAVTSDIRKRTTDFPKGYEHPPHVQIGRYIKKYLTQLSRIDRNEMRAAMKRLREAREDADYRRDANPDDTDLRRALNDTGYVLQTLRIA